METTTSTLMRADPAVIYRLAASVERWPLILPHYRWVRLLRDEGSFREAEMAARRGWIPVRWVTEQRLFPKSQRITFKHVHGVTRGMDVTWTLTPTPEGVLVQIWHGFSPGWRLVPDWLIKLVIGRFFVHAIASRTLACIKALAEAESEPGARP